MNLTGIAAFIIIVVTAGLMLLFTFLHRRYPPAWRDIPAFTRLRRAVGLSVEDGTRLHFSLGRSSLAAPSSAASFAALSLLHKSAELTMVGDRPPVVSSGDSTLTILTQDTLHSAYQTAGAGSQYDPLSAQLTGLTPFSYAAGAIPLIRDKAVSGNVIMGHFGPEIILLTDAAERANTFTVAAAADLPAQAVLYASAQNPLIGEELFASGAYFNAGPMHHASLRVQDILRWLIVASLIGGAIAKLAGLL